MWIILLADLQNLVTEARFCRRSPIHACVVTRLRLKHTHTHTQQMTAQTCKGTSLDLPTCAELSFPLSYSFTLSFPFTIHQNICNPKCGIKEGHILS